MSPIGFRPVKLDGLLDPATFFAVVPAENWNNVVVSNLLGTAALRIRATSTDATTEIILNAGAEQAIAVPYNSAEQTHRFLANKTAFFLKPDSGTGTGVLVLWA